MATAADHDVYHKFLVKNKLSPKWALHQEDTKPNGGGGVWGAMGHWVATVTLPSVPGVLPKGFTTQRSDAKKKNAEGKCVAAVAQFIRNAGLVVGAFGNISQQAKAKAKAKAKPSAAAGQKRAATWDAGGSAPAPSKKQKITPTKGPPTSGASKSIQGDWWTEEGEMFLVKDIQVFAGGDFGCTSGTVTCVQPGHEVPTNSVDGSGEEDVGARGSQVLLKSPSRLSIGCPADESGGLCPKYASYIAWDDGVVWQRWQPEGVQEVKPTPKAKAKAKAVGQVKAKAAGQVKKHLTVTEMYQEREEFGYTISNAKNAFMDYCKKRKLPPMEPELIWHGPSHHQKVTARLKIPMIRKPPLVVEETHTQKKFAINLLYLSVVAALVRASELGEFRSKSQMAKQGAAPIEVTLDPQIVGTVASYLQEVGVEPAPATAMREGQPEPPTNLDVEVDVTDFLDWQHQHRSGLVEMEWSPPTWGGKTPWASATRGVEQQANMHLKNQAMLRKQTPQYKQNQKTVSALPISSSVGEIMDAVNTSVVSIIQGSTGCGKTTQLPQLVLDQAIEQGWGTQCNIVCTQPRRIAAITVAERVASERGEEVGGHIGYNVRFASKMPSRGYASICYMTTGMLLTRLKTGGLNGVSHVIVDEVHERDLETDFLLTVLHTMLTQMEATQVRLVLMSATLDTQKWVSYFGNAVSVEIPGRLHPVQEYYLEDCLEMLGAPCNWQVLSELEKDIPFDFLENLITHVVHESQSAERGAVLVFLPGWDAIQSVDKRIKKNQQLMNAVKVHLVHSQVSKEEQKAAFPPAPAPYVKVILSTNITESSVTIADVVYVLDGCRRKEMVCQITPDGRTSHKLASTWASKQNVKQRAGRAGRLRPGFCYRMVSKKGFQNLPDIPIPDMQRLPLHQVALSVRDLELGEVAEFLAQCPDPPSDSTVDQALRVLQELKAFDEAQSLTYLGRMLARLPVEPQMGYALICSAVCGLAEPMAAMCALTASASPFMNEWGRTQAAVNNPWAATNRPAAILSDHLDLLLTYYDYRSVADGAEAVGWCMQNGIVPAVMKHVTDATDQILGYLERAGFGERVKVPCGLWISRLGTNSAKVEDNQQWALLTMLLGLGQPNFAVRLEGRGILMANNSTAKIAQSAAHSDTGPRLPELPLVLYGEQRSSEWSTKVHTATVIGPIACMLGAARWVQYDTGRGVAMLDGWVPVKLSYEDAAILATLRSTLKMLALRAAADPATCHMERNLTELVGVLMRLVEPLKS